MSKDIVIIGAGGFGREVKWLIERINEEKQSIEDGQNWIIRGFIDDAYQQGTLIDGIPVIGGVDRVENAEQKIYAVCAVGSSKIRKSLIGRIISNPNVLFPNLIDPSVIYSSNVEFGKGIIICAGTILTVNIQVKDFVILNLDCTVGHDVSLESYVTVYPGVNISGQVVVGHSTELGTGSQIVQGKKIGKSAIIGAGSVVVKNIPNNCTAVGCPAIPIDIHR